MMSQIKQYTMVIFLCMCMCAAFIGCSFPGDIYISVSWEFDYDVPDLTFTCDVPNIPTDINDVTMGAYYSTRAGEFTLQYNYSDSTTMRNLDIELEKDVTMLGRENAFYDVIISKFKNPAIYKVPANP